MIVHVKSSTSYCIEITSCQLLVQKQRTPVCGNVRKWPHFGLLCVRMSLSSCEESWVIFTLSFVSSVHKSQAAGSPQVWRVRPALATANKWHTWIRPHVFELSLDLIFLFPLSRHITFSYKLGYWRKNMKITQFFKTKTLTLAASQSEAICSNSFFGGSHFFESSFSGLSNVHNSSQGTPNSLGHLFFNTVLSI